MNKIYMEISTILLRLLKSSLLLLLTLFNVEIKILATIQKIANLHRLKFKGGFRTDSKH